MESMLQVVSIAQCCRFCVLLLSVIIFISSARAGSDSPFDEKTGDPQSLDSNEVYNTTTKRTLSSRPLVDKGIHQLNGFSSSSRKSKKLEKQPKSVEEALEMLANMGHQLQYLIANVDDKKGECNVLRDKLWVLGAVVDAVKEGTITWDQEVFITDELRSLPTGIVQDDPEGSSRTVRELAELMIQISDNTATDLLIGLVGRAAAREAQATYGHHNPNLNRPFFNTKEWLILKLDGAKGDGLPGPLGKQYIRSGKMARRLILARLQNTVISFGLDPSVWDGGPIAIDVLEWFGSPMDICKTMVRLQKDKEAARMLSLNHGVSDEEGIWSHVGFKGGNEPGVLGLSWYLVPAVDTGVGHQVVTGIMWDTENEIDESKAYKLFGALRDLYWKESTSAPTKSPTWYPTTTSPTFDPVTSDLVSLMTQQINHPKPNEKEPTLRPTEAQVSFAEVSIIIKPTLKTKKPKAPKIPFSKPSQKPTNTPTPEPTKRSRPGILNKFPL